MKIIDGRVGLLLAALWLTGCDGLDGGGGGGGGNGDFQFEEGFVFVREDDLNLYVVNSEDESASPEQLTTGGEVSHPSISPDGLQVTYVEGTGDAALLRAVSIEGSAGPRTLLAASEGMEGFRAPVFSPDGATVAFVYDEGPGTATRIGTIGEDGSGLNLGLSPAGESYSSPSFYPASSPGLLVVAGVADQRLERLPLEGGTPTEVAASLAPQVEFISNRVVLSPDGTRAAYDGQLAGGTGSRIFVLELSSGETTQLTEYVGVDEGAQDSFPTWVGLTQVGFANDIGGDSVYVIAATEVGATGSLTVPSASQPWYGTSG